MDATNGGAIEHVTVGQEFTVRVTVDDLRPGLTNGVTSAFFDLLYTSALVSIVDTNPNDGFDFDVKPVLQWWRGFQAGKCSDTGSLDEVGSTQDLEIFSNTPALLFCLRQRCGPTLPASRCLQVIQRTR